MHDTSDLSCARQRTERIALLNDAARQGRDRTARIVMTSGLLAELGGETVAQSMMAQARLMAALRHCTFAPEDRAQPGAHRCAQRTAEEEAEFGEIPQYEPTFPK